MRKVTWSILLASPLTLMASGLVSNPVIAQEVSPANNLIAQTTPNSDAGTLEQINKYSNEGKQDSLNQVTSVDQLRDVSPGDWAYEALRSLVERYGCIAGYPNGTFRGNRALTRYEFAAGLNACLNQIERLISSSEAVIREDLDKLQKLVDEFQAELTALGARVDNLEGRTKFLEDHQFSTTTKLQGEVIFALTDSFKDNDDVNTVFGDRFRLALNTSFTGKDKLVTRLAGNNLAAIDGPPSTQNVNLGGGGNNVAVDWLAYYFPLSYGNVKLDTYVAAYGGIHSDYAQTTNPYFEDYDGGNGALTTFASENPIYRIGGGAGIGASFKIGVLDSIVGPSSVTVGYLAQNADTPTDGNGLFDGNYGALAQLNFGLGDTVNLGLTYVNSYQQAGTSMFNAGGNNAILGTTVANLQGFDKKANSYGAELAWKITKGIHISGFFSYSDVEVINAGANNNASAEVWSYGGGIAFPDLGKEGNVLGIFGGVQPYLGGGKVGGATLSNDKLPIHVEAFYKYKVSDSISITPGVIWIKDPQQGTGEPDSVIGTLRTTFSF